MSDRKDAYTHRSKVVGGSPGPDPSTEHQDPAHASGAGDRNEIDPQRRKGGERTGPTTHDVTSSDQSS
jgi:hypothetical protein